MNKKQLALYTDFRLGLKLKLRNDNLENLDLIHRTIKNHNIDDIDNYIEPKEFNRTLSKDIYNIDKIRLVEQYIKNNKKIALLVDMDADGMTSSSMIYNYFKTIYPEFDFLTIFPFGKLHGISNNYSHIIQEYYKNNFDLLIAPDSSSNDIGEIETLKENNIEVLVIDHHIIDKDNYNKELNIINNQSKFNGNNVNTNFTGVGLTYFCLKYLDSITNRDIADDLLDLFAIGQIGDMSELSDLEVRYYMLQGFKNIQNKLIKTCILSDNVQLSPKGIAFGIVPKINAITRIGDLEDKKALFYALINRDTEQKYIQKRVIRNHHFKYIDLKANVYEYAYNIMKKVKQKQDKDVKKIMQLSKYLSDNKDNVNVVLLPDHQEGITGLIGNKILSTNDKPSFILIKKTNENGDISLKGSMRIPMQYKNSLRILNNKLNHVEYIQGHNNAAGVKFKESVEDFKNYNIPILNSIYDYKQKIHLVDKCFEKGKLPSISEFYNVDKFSNCFGGKVKEPEIAILELMIRKDDINTKNNHLRFNHKGITFMQFTLPEQVSSQLENTENDFILFDIVGNIGVNRFLGRENPQFIINDLELCDQKQIQQRRKDTVIF